MTEACPACPGSMLAEVDPDSLLSYPMKYRWICEACGHVEVREDTYDPEAPQP